MTEEAKSILSDLNRFNISDEIKNEAEHIFQQLTTGTRRGNKRKKLLFYCVYNAYKSLGIIEDAKTIANLIGIPHSDITKSFSLYSETKTNYQPPASFRTPTDFIYKYYSEAGLSSDCLQPLLSLTDEVLASDPDLYESYPQVVACGIIVYYMTINGASVDRKKLAKMAGKSDMTLSKIIKRISAAHNK